MIMSELEGKTLFKLRSNIRSDSKELQEEIISAMRKRRKNELLLHENKR